MRIAFVSLMAGSPWAASEVLWAAAARRALEEGHDVLISTYNWKDRPAALDELERRGAALDLRPFSRWYRRSALFTRLNCTFKPLEQFRADVICVSQGGTYDIARNGSNAVLRSALKRLGTPYLLLCHCEQPAPPRHNLQKAQRVFLNAAIVGMVADKVRSISEAHLAMTLPNARIFHNPVNLQRIERLPWPSAEGPLRCAFVGRLEPVKNLAALIEALGDDKWISRDWSLTVYGAGSDRDLLERQTRQKSLQDRIRFAGYVDDIASVWSEHHVLIMPSRFEGVPLAMIEAMLCGRPVVATNIGGISDWLEEGRSGFLIQKPTPAQIDVALEQLWNRRAQLEQLGRYAYEDTMEKRDDDPAGTLLQWIEETARPRPHSTRKPAAALANAAAIEQPPADACPVPIAMITGAAARPAISVVIPTYEPEKFLIDTLKSVLAQDCGAQTMQIAIVDDGSLRTRAASLLSGIAPAGRIEYYEHRDNLGLAGNWNRAISLARGEFIHILHQDDTVAEGFYARLLAGMNGSERIGMAFCRHAFIDENDRIERISHRERWQAGILPRWLDRIGKAQRIQCPAAIVRRDVYETVGGFRTDLRYALDWEMWVRIASCYDVWYEPEVLAHYRRHGSTETARLAAAGHTSADTMTAIEVLSAHLPCARRERMKHRAYRRLARSHTRRASKLLEAGMPQLAIQQIESARGALERLPENLAKRWMKSQLVRVDARLGNHPSEADQR